MKVFTVKFDGMWPVGNCLVIKANSTEEAESIAKETITHTDEFSVEEVDMSTSGVIVYLSGNY